MTVKCIYCNGAVDVPSLSSLKDYPSERLVVPADDAKKERLQFNISELLAIQFLCAVVLGVGIGFGLHVLFGVCVFAAVVICILNMAGRVRLGRVRVPRMTIVEFIVILAILFMLYGLL